MQFDAVGARHLDVEQSDIVVTAGQFVQGAAGIRARADVVVFALKPLAKRIANDRIVIDDQDCSFGHTGSEFGVAGAAVAP